MAAVAATLLIFTDIRGILPSGELGYFLATRSLSVRRQQG
ncbi:hypothetical protein ATK86_3793 [Nocardia fluminea]|uniref:Uncharacterized protein n=1 Tax=Nocardia fluminea TaxID=134984 RepID=A0A2N3VCQ2_9NOCA|nr:hypothetical protein ATK86_3793 [Nocardia fluminea]